MQETRGPSGKGQMCTVVSSCCVCVKVVRRDIHGTVEKRDIDMDALEEIERTG